MAISLPASSQLVVVPNAINPYGYEMVNILAYPSGFLQRFRFEDEWVEAGINVLVGSDGYIVLRDRDTGILYPIRRFKLVSLSRVGTVHYLVCRLGELFNFDSEIPRQSGQIVTFNNEFLDAKSTLKNTNQPGADMKPLLFKTGYYPTFIDNVNSTASGIQDIEAERWGNLLACINNISFFSGVEFLRIVTIRELNKPTKTASIKDDAYIFDPGKSYEVLVAQYRIGGIGNGATPRDIELIGDGSSIIPVRAKERAVGKYDILSLVLRLDRTAKTKKTFFDIKFTPLAQATAYVNPVIHVPVIISPPLITLGVKLFLAVFLIIVYFVPNALTTFTALMPATILQISAATFTHDLTYLALTVTMLDLINELKK